MTDGDRIDDIRERLESLNQLFPNEDIEWLLDKLDEAHRMYYNLRHDYQLDIEEIYRLRDEVNALWDVVWSFTKNDEEVDKASQDFIDFYNRDIKEAKDFSVQIDNWRDLKNMVAREKTNFYIFNPSKKLYELDTALSNYDDVFYYLPLNLY